MIQKLKHCANLQLLLYENSTEGGLKCNLGAAIIFEIGLHLFCPEPLYILNKKEQNLINLGLNLSRTGNL